MNDRKDNKKMQHTFVICAYGESPYLFACIQSVIRQRETSDVIMMTSTDNDYIRKASKEYDIPLFINTGEGGITQDWNFALSVVKTPFATITHQDDLYHSEYSTKIQEYLKKAKKPLIAFTDYFEIRDKEHVYYTQMLKIKRAMLFPLKNPKNWKNRFIRRRILSFGDAICCPSVTFCLENIPKPLFAHHFRSDEDWEAWERLSRMNGEFVYVPMPLMGHRIHEDSETTKIIADGRRIRENYEMYRKFWPAPIAKILNRYYTKAEHSNHLGEDHKQ